MKPALATARAVDAPALRQPAPSVPAPAAALDGTPPTAAPAGRLPVMQYDALGAQRAQGAQGAEGAQDPRAEQVRTLRAELQLRRAPGMQGDIVALLSPGAGEGRSQLAAELAIAFAEVGHATLLVDANLRRPRQHTLFGLAAGPGLAEAIEGPQWPAFRAVDGLPGLALLTAGETRHDPLELLCSPRLALLVSDWRDTFDQVVIDTPPAGAFVDALAVASVAGRVLVLSRARHTPSQQLHDLFVRLGTVRAQVLGAVISHF